MKRTLACAALLLALVQLAWSAGEEVLPLRRLAMYIGSTNGGPGRVRLRYAAEAARAMAGVMQELGGIAAGDSLVLLAPTSEDLLDGLQAVRQRVQAVRSGSGRIEFLLYYSGHSDEQGLLLGGELLEYSRLKSSLQEVQADVNIAILDSCSSGAFTRLKGGTRQPPFLLDESSQMQGHAFISSSSADEAAQESDRVNGSFFTHFLISGLRGAADSTRDGQVSLNEAYYFAFNETLSRTQHTQGGAQHPSYNIQLTGSGDLTLTDLRAAACAVRLDEGLEGRLFVRDGRGRLMVELRKERDVLVDLGLPEGRYELSLEKGGRLLVASLSLRPGAVAPAIRRVTLERFLRVFEVAGHIRPRTIVFHPSYDERYYVSSGRQWLENSIATWSRLLPLADRLDTRIALENVYEQDPGRIGSLLDALPPDRVGFCFDTGHFNAFAGAPLEAWMERLGHRLIEIHLHDNRGAQDEHLPVGEGTFPFERLFALVRDRGLRPILTVEAHTEQNLSRTLENIGGRGLLEGLQGEARGRAPIRAVPGRS